MIVFEVKSLFFFVKCLQGSSGVFTIYQLSDRLIISLVRCMDQREAWSSKIGFILAVTGAAVGLGNLWKFPYMVGSHGGSAFLVLYIISVLIFVGER